jgi:hypothetical protein
LPGTVYLEKLRAVGGKQPYPSAAEQQERVEVRRTVPAAGDQPPVQAGRGRAVPRLQRPDPLPPPHKRTDPDAGKRGHRLVRGAQRAVPDDHDVAVDEEAGVEHDPVPGGENRLT